MRLVKKNDRRHYVDSTRHIYQNLNRSPININKLITSMPKVPDSHPDIVSMPSVPKAKPTHINIDNIKKMGWTVATRGYTVKEKKEAIKQLKEERGPKKQHHSPASRPRHRR